METETTRAVVTRRPIGRLVMRALIVLLLFALILLWLARVPIAGHYLDRELARRGVRASYRFSQIGLGAERLENVVIGDPADPDLTARWVMVRLSWGFRRPRIALVDARGVRLHGRLVDGQLKLGDVDKLNAAQPLPGPFRLPDLALDIADAALRLDTDDGRIGIAVEGKGNPAGRFRGTMAVVAHRLSVGNCAISEAAGSWAVAVDRRRPHLVGPARFASVDCSSALAVAGVALATDTRLAPGLDRWTGRGTAAVSSLRFSGNRLAGLEARLDFDGNAARTAGHVAFAAAGARASGFAAGRIGASGIFDLAPKSARYGFAGDVRASAVRGGESVIAPVVAGLTGARATPVEPVIQAWGAALRRALESGVDAVGLLHIVQAPGRGRAEISRLSAASRSGARLEFVGGGGATYSWPAGTSVIDGDVSLLGGGLPRGRFSLSQAAGRSLRGVGRIEPYAAGGARLALDSIRFAAVPGGTTDIGTIATVDGPFGGGGSVKGLVLPIAGRIDRGGGFAFGESCALLAFRSVQQGNLRLGPLRLPLCPAGRALLWKAPGGPLRGGAIVRDLRLAGSLGKSPVFVAARDFRLDLAGPDFTGSGFSARLGSGDGVSRLDIGSLGGRLGKEGFAGTYERLAGRIAAVPLLVSEGRGRWQYVRGVLGLAGSLRVADQQTPPRFMPLVSDDFRLSIVQGRIDASGRLKEPKTGIRIAEARIDHRLATGAGHAFLDVPGVAFDEHFQPEQLTALTVGVVALVRGILKGKGEIGWTPAGSTSTGTFSTEGMNLAASFGPVEGLTTSVHFTDLLGLVSAPGQAAETSAIRTGVDVFDGRIRYQLLPSLQVRVEGATWPFAGGTLTLDETILDFSRPSVKRLTFHVAAMDGARFIQLMQFSNISGTGTFDGVLPMIFDERGGRIVGGRLVAREGGGTLSYVGELTDKQLGAYGKLAFDALKALRYRSLSVDLNGALEGEFLAGIHFDGIARDPSISAAPSGGISGMVVGRALGQLAKIPVKFNISVRGPFRAVIGTARSLQDPTNLIQSVLPQMLRDRPAATTVQPNERGSVP